jgi:hypothetical protein
MLYVGRNAERRTNERLPASAATCEKVMNGDHSTIAVPWVSMPRRPARPVSCVYSAGVSSSRRSPLNFVIRSMTTARAGMLMPSARVSVANTTFTRPSRKHASTASLNGGTCPAWWAATPASSPASQRSASSASRSVSVSEVRWSSAMRRIRARSS